MNHDKLAPVYLDNKPVTLKDAKPKISAILSEFGKTAATQVKWLKSQTDTQGKSLSAEETIDRTAEPAKPIYLTSSTKEQSGMNAGGRSGGAEGFKGGSQQFQKRESGQGHDQTSETSRSGSVGSGSGESSDKTRQGQGGGKGQFEQARGKGQGHVQESEGMGAPEVDADAESDESYGGGRQNEPAPSAHGQGEGRGAQSEARRAIGAVGGGGQAKGRPQQDQNREGASQSNERGSTAKPGQRDDEKVAGNEDVDDVRDDERAAGNEDSGKQNKRGFE